MPELSLSKSALLTDLSLCINRYRMFTPGIYVCVHVPVELDARNRIVPGLVAMVNHGRLKQCDAEEQGFVGAPNFVLDVFAPHELEEYEARRATFGHFGVIEYVAVISEAEPRCYWNRQTDNGFVAIEADDAGMIKSKALPGLWFSPSHAKNRNWWAMMGQIERGVTRLGHHEFMETIWHKDG